MASCFSNDSPVPEVRFLSDVAVAAPVARPSPRNDAAWSATAVGDASAGDCPVYVNAQVLEQAQRFAATDPERELGGFLVGGRFRDGAEEYVWVEEFLEARHVESGSCSARITAASFADAWARIEAAPPRGYAPLLVGWFHTHPGFGPALSARDRFVHRGFFNLPFLVALVTDPLSGETRLHRWREGEIESGGFWQVGPRPA